MSICQGLTGFVNQKVFPSFTNSPVPFCSEGRSLPLSHRAQGFPPEVAIDGSGGREQRTFVAPKTSSPDDGTLEPF